MLAYNSFSLLWTTLHTSFLQYYGLIMDTYNLHLFYFISSCTRFIYVREYVFITFVMVTEKKSVLEYKPTFTDRILSNHQTFANVLN